MIFISFSGCSEIASNRIFRRKNRLRYFRNHDKRRTDFLTGCQPAGRDHPFTQKAAGGTRTQSARDLTRPADGGAYQRSDRETVIMGAANISGCIMYCFSALFRKFVRDRDVRIDGFYR